MRSLNRNYTQVICFVGRKMFEVQDCAEFPGSSAASILAYYPKVTSEGCLAVSSLHFSTAKLLVGSLQIRSRSPALNHTTRPVLICVKPDDFLPLTKQFKTLMLPYKHCRKSQACPCSLSSSSDSALFIRNLAAHSSLAWSCSDTLAIRVFSVAPLITLFYVQSLLIEAIFHTEFLLPMW